MILVVTGGRDYCLVVPGKTLAQAELEVANLVTALDRTHKKTPITALVHGGQRGADLASGEWATMRGVTAHSVPIDHALDGPWPGAGPRRNTRALEKALQLARDLNVKNGYTFDYAIPLGLTAFPGGRGTKNMVDQFTKLGLGHKIWRPYG